MESNIHRKLKEYFIRINPTKHFIEEGRFGKQRADLIMYDDTNHLEAVIEVICTESISHIIQKLNKYTGMRKIVIKLEKPKNPKARAQLNKLGQEGINLIEVSPNHIV